MKLPFTAGFGEKGGQKGVKKGQKGSNMRSREPHETTFYGRVWEKGVILGVLGAKRVKIRVPQRLALK